MFNWFVELLYHLYTPEYTPPMPIVTPEPPQQATRRISNLANAIEMYEGMDKTCNNPLALRWSPTENGSRTYPGKGTFAYFNSYQAGFAAGVFQLTIIQNGTSPVFNHAARLLGLTSCSLMTIFQMISTYSPSSDGNHPLLYATFLGKQLGVDPNVFQMKDFIT